MAGVKPEDREALSISPAEEIETEEATDPSCARRYGGDAWWCFSLFISWFVRKKDSVDASAGASRRPPTETGTAAGSTSTGQSGNLVVSDVLLRSFSVPDSFL